MILAGLSVLHDTFAVRLLGRCNVVRFRFTAIINFAAAAAAVATAALRCRQDIKVYAT